MATAPNADIRYNLTLTPEMNKDLEDTARGLGVSKAEAIRRALTLMKYAVKGEKVQVIRGKEAQTILVK
jgi:hypothetical protein